MRRVYIVLPGFPGDGADLTEAQLASLAGGSIVAQGNSVQTLENVTTEVQVAETTTMAAAEIGAAAVCVIVAS